MFFFGVFGIQGKQKEIKDITNEVCKACGKMSSYKLIKTYNYFHIFFIPIFKWNEIYYVQSRCCGSIFKINNDLGKSIEKGEKLSIEQQDLELVSKGSYHFGNIVCSNCGREIDGDFKYCPHCGKEIH